MPLDRFITLRIVQPWHELEASRPTQIPILMYHRITDDPPTADPRRLCTSIHRFRSQMQWLHEAGWRGVSVSEALASRASASDRPLCAITFDDGFRDFLTLAAPVLRHYNFEATIYLPTAFIGRARMSFKSHECLTWSEVKDLHGQGFEFGSHTIHHPRLHDLPWTDVCRELADSKTRIESELATHISGFSFPYAFPQADRVFAKASTDLLNKIGYQHAVTTVIGCADRTDNHFLLKRLPVSGSDDQPLFLAKLKGDYDWLARPQSWAKHARYALTGHA